MKVRSLLLPREYQQVEYIESSGTQYIDTGLGMKASLSFDLTILPTNRGTDERFLGAYGSGIYIGQLSSKWRYGSSCTYNDVAIDYDNPTRITVFNGNQWTFNDVTKTAPLGTNNQKLVIFGATYQTNPNVPYGYGSCKLYSCKIYDNNVLNRNYIPCYRKSDNVIGLYDLAIGTFYTNAGSGTFIKGNDISVSYKTPVALEGTTNLISGIASVNSRCSKSGNGVFVDWSSSAGDTYFFFSMRSQPTTNTTYTLSFKVSGLNGETGIVWSWSNLNGNQYKTEIKDGMNAITFTLDGTETRCFFDDKANKTGVSFYMYDFQLEAKDHATLYVNGTRANNTIVSAKPKIVLEGTTNLFPSQYQNAKFISGASGNTLANAAGSFSINCTIHGTYTLSGYYKLASTDTATNPRVTLCAKYSGDTNATQLVRTVGSQEKDDKWHYFAITGTTNTSKTLTNLSGWIFDYSKSGSGRNIECKCIQLELKDHATYYTPSTRANNTII